MQMSSSEMVGHPSPKGYRYDGSGQSDGGVLRPPCHQIWGHQWGRAPLGGTGHAPIGSCPHLDGYTPTACRHPDGLLGTHPVIPKHQRTHTPLDAKNLWLTLTTIWTALRGRKWRVGHVTTPRHHHRTGPHPGRHPGSYETARRTAYHPRRRSM